MGNLDLFPISLLDQLIEENPALLIRTDEIFSTRTKNCLISEGLIYIGDLILINERHLLRIPNIGRKCLKEIVEVINALNFHFGTKLPNWPPSNIEVLRKKYSNQIVKAHELLYLRTHDAIASSLEEELFNIANQYGERNAQIFIQRMGWDGTGGKTLDSVGKKYGMTRERVRQICSKLENKIRLNRPPIKFARQAIEYVNQRIPCAASVIENEIAERKISRGLFRIEGLINTSYLLGCEAQFDIEKIGRKKTRLAVPISLLGTPKIIRSVAQKHIEHWGAGTISDIICKIETEYDIEIPESLAVLILESMEGFCWLDQKSGWFWFVNNRRNRLLNLIRKISSVAERLTLDELRSGIMRTHRMKGYSPPKRVLKAICEQSNEFKVQDDIVLGTPPLKWEEVLEGTNEYDLVLALKTFGPVLTRSDLEILCQNKGMNRSSFYVYLGYSPLIQRYSRGVYGLRGANVAASDIKQLMTKVEIENQARAISVSQSKVLLDYGRTTEGKIWVIYRLSDNSIYSGVITTPGPMKKYLNVEFPLYSTDGICMGALKSNQGSTWGLGPFFRRRGGEAGDYMLLLYDLELTKVTAELGDEDLLDRFLAE